MFDIFTDPAKMAQQMEVILNNYGFAIWETLYSLALEVLFAYMVGLPLGVLLVTGEKDGIRPVHPLLMRKRSSPRVELSTQFPMYTISSRLRNSLEVSSICITHLPIIILLIITPKK